MASSVRRYVVGSARVGAAAVSAAAVIYLAGIAGKAWKAHINWQIAAIAVVGATAFVSNLPSAIQDFRRPGRIRRNRSVRGQLEAAWFAVADAAGVDPRDILVSLFLLTGRGKSQRLVRFGQRVGIKQLPESNVRWTKGKGIIGRCWQNEATERMDLTAINRKHGDCTPEQWSNASADTQMGLPFEDWKKTRKKYDMIIAVPMFHDNHFVGCVSLTGPTHNSTWIADSKVEQALGAATHAIAVTYGF